MAHQLATAEECQPIYTLLEQINQLAPWQWMTENDIFGVQGPDAAEPDFVSVIGRGGDPYGVTLYLGIRGLFRFWHFVQNSASLPPEERLQIAQLQAVLTDRTRLTPQDRELLNAVGIRPRGSRPWPQLRSYGPALLPWQVETADIPRLQLALEQVLDVAPRFREHKQVIHVPGQNQFLIRVGEQQSGQTVWQDRIQTIDSAPEVLLEFEMDLALLEQVKALPRAQHTVEIDFFKMPKAVQRPEIRPHFPYNLLLVESQSGEILGTDLLEPLPTPEAMWAQIPVRLVQLLAGIGAVPAAVTISSPVLLQLLPPLGAELGIQITRTQRLPRIDSNRRELIRMLEQYY